MVLFLSINFFSCISSIFVRFFKRSRFLCQPLYTDICGLVVLKTSNRPVKSELFYMFEPNVSLCSLSLSFALYRIVVNYTSVHSVTTIFFIGYSSVEQPLDIQVPRKISKCFGSFKWIFKSETLIFFEVNSFPIKWKSPEMKINDNYCFVIIFKGSMCKNSSLFAKDWKYK